MDSDLAEEPVLEHEADPDAVLTLVEAAALLRISVSTAKKLAARGNLPGILPKVGVQWRVNERVLRQFLNTPVCGARVPR